MKPAMPIGIVALILLVPAAQANHPCFPTQADPAVVHAHQVPFVGTFYTEYGDPVVGGAWTYKESNGLGGLQRGAIGPLGDYFPPGCDSDPDWKPADGRAPCLVVGEGITDESCHNGPDMLLVGARPILPAIISP